MEVKHCDVITGNAQTACAGKKKCCGRNKNMIIGIKVEDIYVCL